MANRDDWIGGYSDNGDGSITWHVNRGQPVRINHPEEPMITTRPTAATKPKHGFIRGILGIAGLLALGIVTRSFLTANSAPGAALVTSGAVDILSALVMLAVVVAVLLLGKRRGRTRR